MAHSQIINDLMANLRRSHSVKRERSSLVLLRSILTSSSPHKTTPSGFLLHYPALMDPRNFLRLITKYTLKDILIWANSGRKMPVVSGPNIHELSKKVIELMGERTPGGEDTLRKIIDIVKSHNRLDDVKHRSTRIFPEVIRMGMDAWYECISQSTTADFKLPLYFTDMSASRKALTLLLKSKDTQRLSFIFSELLHDPLFPYCSLQEIPDLVLLEWCATHSYPHVLDKLKVNDPRVTTTLENIQIRVERLLHAPVTAWAPEDPVETSADDDTESINSDNSLFTDNEDMKDAVETSFDAGTKSIKTKNSLFMDDADIEDAVESSADDDTYSIASDNFIFKDDDDMKDAVKTKRIDSMDTLFTDDDDMEGATTQGSESVDKYFQHCVHCLDDGVAKCEVNGGLRQPGKVCAQRETLGKPCEDRLASERHVSLVSKKFEQDYRKRQRYDGHVRERAAEHEKLRQPLRFRVFAVRQHLYLLLLDEFSGWHVFFQKASTLCLPKKKPIESEILALVESISEPHATPSSAKGHAALPSASDKGKENIPIGTDLGPHDKDDETEYNVEDLVMTTCSRLTEGH